MSGIFGFIGKRACKDLLLGGLYSLRSRGCDMTGMAIKHNDGLTVIKANGDTSVLRQKAESTDADGDIGIGQTDFPLRARATAMTAKPACNDIFAICIDGEIAEFESLRRWCRSPFPITTDEELALAMLCVMDDGDSTTLLKRMVSSIHDAPTLAFISSRDNAIYCFRGDMPLIIGIGSDGFFIASEVNAIAGICGRHIALQPGDHAVISREKIVILDQRGKKIKRSATRTPAYPCDENDFDPSDDIYYCPLVVKEAYEHFVADARINFDYLKLSRHYIGKLRRIYVIGSCDSFPVAIIGGSDLAYMTDIQVQHMLSSEMLRSPLLMDSSTLVLCVSHSGEDSESILALRRCKKSGARIISITDSPFSEVARLSDAIIDPQCPLSRTNVSLRSFFADYTAMCMLSVYIGRQCEIASDTYYNVLLKMMELLPGKALTAIKSYAQLDNMVNKLMSSGSIIFTGCRQDYAIAMEGARMMQRLAEIGVVYSELSSLTTDYCATINGHCTVLCILTCNDLLHSTLHYLRKIRMTGANVIIYTTSNLEQQISDFDSIVTFNDSVHPLDPIPCIAGLYNAAIIARSKKMSDIGTDIAV